MSDFRESLRVAKLTVVVWRDSESNEVHAALVEVAVEVVVLVDEDWHASEVRLLRWKRFRSVIRAALDGLAVGYREKVKSGENLMPET